MSNRPVGNPSLPRGHRNSFEDQALRRLQASQFGTFRAPPFCEKPLAAKHLNRR